MKRARRRKCCYCKALFIADARNRWHQRYCREDACRKVSKASSQRGWVEKPENQDYFSGPENVARVQAWRARTLQYWKRHRSDKVATVTRCLSPQNTAQPIETTVESVNLPLQDVLPSLLATYDPVIIGLIAHLTGTTLQDDIASTSQNLIRLGQDVLRQSGGSDGNKTTHMPRPEATHTEAV